jgi:hypothetical protein
MLLIAFLFVVSTFPQENMGKIIYQSAPNLVVENGFQNSPNKVQSRKCSILHGVPLAKNNYT